MTRQAQPREAPACARGGVLSPLPCLTMRAWWDRRTRLTAALVVSHGESNANKPRASPNPGRMAPSIPGWQAAQGAHGWHHVGTVGSSAVVVPRASPCSTTSHCPCQPCPPSPPSEARSTEAATLMPSPYPSTWDHGPPASAGAQTCT